MSTEEPDPPPPFQRHSQTSQEAAASIAAGNKQATLRQKVHDYLLFRGEAGATDEEMQRALEMGPSTQRPRRIELVRMGLARDTGRTRLTASGRKAVVWSAAAAAPAAVAGEERPS
jgi:hypothetical protein